MNIDTKSAARCSFRIIFLALTTGTALFSAACAPVVGYPHDPEDTDATLTSLQPYFQPAAESKYQDATPAQKAAVRNEIVLNRMRAYNIEFDNFQKNLWAEGNVISTGGDLIALILSGLGATTGGAGTKAALSAATAGIVGAQAAISRDLYYQRTLPALLAQMEANRAKVELTIMSGLAKLDNDYTLYKAEIDLKSLKTAGSMPSAVSVITQQASQNNQSAQAQLAALHSLPFSTSSTSQRMRAWLYPGGKETDTTGKAIPPDVTKSAALQQWMSKDTVDPNLHDIPPEQLIDGGDTPELEADRARAITDLKIP